MITMKLSASNDKIWLNQYAMRKEDQDSISNLNLLNLHLDQNIPLKLNLSKRNFQRKERKIPYRIHLQHSRDYQDNNNNYNNNSNSSNPPGLDLYLKNYSARNDYSEFNNNNSDNSNRLIPFIKIAPIKPKIIKKKKHKSIIDKYDHLRFGHHHLMNKLLATYVVIAGNKNKSQGQSKCKDNNEEKSKSLEKKGKTKGKIHISQEKKRETLEKFIKSYNENHNQSKNDFFSRNNSIKDISEESLNNENFPPRLYSIKTRNLLSKIPKCSIDSDTGKYRESLSCFPLLSPKLNETIIKEKNKLNDFLPMQIYNISNRESAPMIQNNNIFKLKRISFNDKEQSILNSRNYKKIPSKLRNFKSYKINEIQSLSNSELKRAINGYKQNTID